ncbi:MAG: hypothetical protein AAFQ84_10510, partial [Pseudomonadota bacterium]
SEWRWLDARSADTTPHLIAKRHTGHAYSCDHGANGGPIHVLSNYSGATDFQIFAAEPDRGGPEAWTPLVAHKAGRLIQDIVSLKDYLIRLERENGLPFAPWSQEYSCPV